MNIKDNALIHSLAKFKELQDNLNITELDNCIQLCKEALETKDVDQSARIAELKAKIEILNQLRYNQANYLKNIEAEKAELLEALKNSVQHISLYGDYNGYFDTIIEKYEVE
jgi:hypothetical protein